MDLEKSLAQIERPKRDDERAEQIRKALIAKQTKQFQLQLWTRRCVLASILVIAAFFIATPNLFLHDQQAYTPFTTDADIVKVQMLRNETPNRHLDASSLFYLETKTLMDSETFKDLQTILKDAQMASEPVYGKIKDEAGAYEYYVTYDNGEARQFKLVIFDSADYLYDTKANLRYKLSHAQYTLVNGLQYEAYQKKEPKSKWLGAFLLLFPGLVLADWFIFQKRYLLVSKKEAKARRRQLKLLNTLVPFLVFIPLVLSKYFLGATHLGLVLACFLISAVLTEYVEIKDGIKRANFYFVGIHICLIVTLFTLFFI